jgi:rhodanese-related sulfurtransferase
MKKINEVEKIIKSMDFEFFGKGEHKIDIESFLKKKDSVLLDVRSIEETSTVKLVLKNYLPVYEIPLCELPNELNQLPFDKFIGIFCSSGVRSAIAFAYLKSKGFANVRMIDGGYSQLMEAVMPGKVFKHINK